MDLPVRIIGDKRWTVDLPHDYLNLLLENQHDFAGGILCLKITTMFDIVYYCCMNEFTRDSSTIDIPEQVNSYLNLCDDTFINVSREKLQVPQKVVLQGHREAFGTIVDIKEKLENLFSDIKILNKGCTYVIEGEPFDVIQMCTGDSDISAGLIVECELEIDFIRTIEGLERERERQRESHRETHVAQPIDVGNQLGGRQLTKDEVRLARLARLETKPTINNT